MNLLLVRILAVPLLACPGFSKDLEVTRLTSTPSGPEVFISNPRSDPGGNTSIRHFRRDGRELKFDEVLGKHYFYRDRDLGQTFRTGDKGFRLTSVTVRTGFGSIAVLEGALGAELYLQIFEVSGEPRINDHGTTAHPPGTRWRTFDPTRPETDDYIEGETYANIGVFRGGFVPADLDQYKSDPAGVPGNGQYLQLAVTAESSVLLEPHTSYGFLIGFVEAGDKRSLTFANRFTGTYDGGHGVRREGSPETPAFFNPAESPRGSYVEALLVDDPHDKADLAAGLDAACFAADFAQRVGNLYFGTMGMPDVCTSRDLTFFISGEPLPSGADNPSSPSQNPNPPNP